MSIPASTRFWTCSRIVDLLFEGIMWLSSFIVIDFWGCPWMFWIILCFVSWVTVLKRDLSLVLFSTPFRWFEMSATEPGVSSGGSGFFSVPLVVFIVCVLVLLVDKCVFVGSVLV